VASVVQLKCPRCQSDQKVGLGESRCGVCRLKFTIGVEVPKCPNCGFNIHGLTRAVCPECGLHLDDEDVPVSGAAAGGESQGEIAGGGPVPATQ